MTADDRLSGRPSGRDEDDVSSVPGTGAGRSRLAGGTVASTTRRHRSSHYLTLDQLAGIAESLSTEDQKLVDIVRQFRLATGRQLTLLGFGDGDANARAARRTLKRLVELGLMIRLERRIGGARAGSNGYVYRIGVAGMRLAGEKRRVHDEPGLHHVQHTLAITELYVCLKSAERAGELSVLTFETEPACWRPYAGKHGQPEMLKPDGFCELRLGGSRRLWFVEVDRGTISTGSLRQKLQRYSEYLDTGAEQLTRQGVFPRVVWACDQARRAEHIKALASTENARLGGELHRLLGDEWRGPP